MGKALKKKRDRQKGPGEFSLGDKILITATSVVAFGGFVFCTIMIVLMNSIDY